MFVIFATKPLNDGTKGVRFNALGTKGIVRIRKLKHNGWFTRCGSTEMPGRNFGKVSVYVEAKRNRMDNNRRIRHFAG